MDLIKLLDVASPKSIKNVINTLITEYENVAENFPTKLSDLTDDETHRLVTDTEKASWNAKLSAIPNDYKTKTENDNLYQPKGNYLTSFTESDPTVPAHVKSITAGDINNWNKKQDAIDDLSTIRSGASLGTTAVQPNSLGTLASKNAVDYNTEVTNKPTIPSIVGLASEDFVNAKDATTLNSSKSYTDNKVNTLKEELLGPGTSEAIDTIYELAEVLQENKDVVTTLNDAIANKVDKTTKINNKTLTQDITLTKYDIGLTKVSQLENDIGFISTYTETDPTVPEWAKAPTKPSYNYSEINNTPTIPIVNNSTITIKQGEETKGTFTLNQSNNSTIELDVGGGGGSNVTLYETIGQNTNGAMTQKAVTDELANCVTLNNVQTIQGGATKTFISGLSIQNTNYDPGTGTIGHSSIRFKDSSGSYSNEAELEYEEKSEANSFSFHLKAPSSAYAVNRLKLIGDDKGKFALCPENPFTMSLGSKASPWNLTYLSGKIMNAGYASDYGLLLPPTGSWDEDKYIATTEDLKDYATKDDVSFNLPMGAIFESATPQTSKAFHLLDGSVLDATVDASYQTFINYINSVAAEYNIAVTNEEYEAILATYGQCGKFVVTSTSVRLPTVTKHTEGLIDLTNIGEAVAAGLPNITGQIRADIVTSYTTGAFQNGEIAAVTNTVGGSGNFNASTVLLDASKQPNSIYGKSDTVQTDTIKYPYYIVVSTKEEVLNLETLTSEWEISSTSTEMYFKHNGTSIMTITSTGTVLVPDVEV